MAETFCFSCDSDAVRIDKFLVDNLDDVSRSAIQKIIDEEKAAGHQKEVTRAVFEEFNLTKAENLACGYYTDRVKYEAYAPYWLEHIHQEPDEKITSDLLPGMTWHPEAGVWVFFSEPSFTLMMPPTQAEIDAQHKEDTERFKKYLKEVMQK